MRVEKLRDLVARLHAQPRRRLTLLVGLDGPAGSGKTTLARALAGLDPGIERVETGEFAMPQEARHEASSKVVGDGFDWRRLRSQVLLPLSRDAPVQYQPYDREGGAFGDWRELAVGGIVVVEGFYACMKQLATFYDFRIWVEAPGHLRRKRLAGQLNGRAEDMYVAAQDPARSAHLRIDGAAAVDPFTQYVRTRR